MATSRTILIGDIHGCAFEFGELLEMLSPDDGDTIVLMGDLLNKGPDPEGVLQTFESLGCISLLGNHDLDHLEWSQGLVLPKPESVSTRRMMSEPAYSRYLEAVRNMSLIHQTPDFVAVHGAIISDVPLENQPADVLTGKTTIDPSWKDRVDLDRPVVVGHKRYNVVQEMPFVIPGKFYGIDTGCVYGGSLTALILPGGLLIQVKAARNYCL